MKTFSSVYEKARVVSKAQRKKIAIRMKKLAKSAACLLYTSDAADDA